MEILGILADRARHTREYHNTNIPSEPEYRKDLWSGVRAEFERRGFQMQDTGNRIIFTKPGSKDHGFFDVGERGVEAAWEVLRGGM